MRRRIVPVLICTILILAGVIASVGSAPTQSETPTSITWQEGLDVALAQSQASGKPVLTILQDQPNCAHCQAFERDIAAYPLLVEAVANEFITLKLDRRQYPGPATRSQHLLFLNAEGEPLIPHSARTESAYETAANIIAALKAAHRPVPNYLHAAVAELDTTKHKRAAFAMFCYWVGEYELGKIDGVVATEAGWLEGREVTLVRYHQDQIALPDLARKAADVKCARKVFAPTEAERREVSELTRLQVGSLDERYRIAKPSDQKKQIERWDLSGVSNLTPMQLTKINALAPDAPRRALEWLSPRQRRELPTALARYVSR